jgi:predicted DNA-binding protein with PD1-like motif
MRYASFGDSFLLRLETDEEIFGAISGFAADRKIDVGTVQAIGAAYDVVLAYYDRRTHEYHRRAIAEEMEVVSLLGNISLKEGRPFPHLHAVLSGRSGETIAGHFFEGRVGGTIEAIIRPLGGYAQRKYDEKTGLFLLEI